MNYQKQAQKQKRKQMQIAKQQQLQQRDSLHRTVKPASSSKFLLSFIVLCAVIGSGLPYLNL